MATSENRAHQIKVTIESMISWQTTRRDEILHKELGKESFIELDDDLRMLTYLLSGVVNFDYKLLPENISGDFYNLLNIIHSLYSEMQVYYGGSRREELIKRFESHYKPLFTFLTQIMAISQPFNVTTEWNKLRMQIIQAQDEIKKKGNETDNKMAVALQTLSELTEKNKDLGIRNYASLFGDEAKSFRNKAYLWLAAGILTFGLILFFGFNLLNLKIETIKGVIPSDGDKLLIIYYIVQQSVTKILIASSLFFALSVCIKNYRANIHNQTVNQHRSTALKSFQAFSESPSDEQTKNAVLLEATKTIFSHQHSGFSTSDKDADMSSKIIEIIKPIKVD